MTIYILILVLFVLILIISNKSKFSSMLQITDNYSCDDPNVRTFPSGNIPGGYLKLNEPEKEELLRKFVEFGKKG